jgi:hypothetical protein
MRRIRLGLAVAAATTAAIGTGIFGFGSTAMASADAGGTPTFTTLDACGYFYGYQTAVETRTDSSGATTQNGQWTGVWNNYFNTRVASLGEVKGSFTQTTSTDSLGNVTGTEEFRSGAGKIDQTFTYGPSVPGGFSVTVTATRDLAFLTSSTQPGQCYTGPFPRP